MLKSIILALSSVLMFCTVNAQVLDGKAPQVTYSLEQVARTIPAGTVLVVGEIHGKSEIQRQQMELLNHLRNQGRRLSVGMEFLNAVDQSFVDQYTTGVMTEDDFKTAINWSGIDFKFYKQQINFPQKNQNETTVALNVPADVTKQIARGGVESLSVDQRSLLPLDFQMGNDLYKERFIQSIGHPLPANAVDNYFAAQSAWDESMSYHTVEFLKNNPQDIMVIIVGEFHVQYGGGLPDRLRDRLNQAGLSYNVVTISQVMTDGLSEDEINLEINPSEAYGYRADYILLNP